MFEINCPFNIIETIIFTIKIRVNNCAIIANEWGINDIKKVDDESKEQSTSKIEFW